jgi:hypothetical protein
MYRGESNPAWFRDVKWVGALLLVASLAAATLTFSLTQLTAEGQGTALLRQVLQLTLLPEGVDEGAVEVRQGVDFRPGEALTLLPGVEVFADATEVGVFRAEDAVGRIAGVLADGLVQSGTTGAYALVTNAGLRDQLDQAFAGPVPLIVRSRLAAALLPSGLEDGSRLADWPTQAVQNPGELVQPIVGVFVYADPAELRELSNRSIGNLVVDRLAETVLDEGLAAAQATITNSNLLARLTSAVDEEARADLHGLLRTVLTGRQGEIASRLEQAQAVLVERESEPQGLLGILSAEQLAGLSPEQANARVLSALAERSYAGGTPALAALLTEPDQAARLDSVTSLVDGLSLNARNRYLRQTWIFGLASLLFAAVVAGFSSGWGRLVNIGLAVAFSAAGGAALFWQIANLTERAVGAALPGGVRSEGVFAYLRGLLAYVGANTPQTAFDLLLRNHLVVLAVGAGVVVIALLIRLLGAMRPRRRSLL